MVEALQPLTNERPRKKLHPMAQTHIWTWRFLDQLGPRGRVGENGLRNLYFFCNIFFWFQRPLFCNFFQNSKTPIQSVLSKPSFWFWTIGFQMCKCVNCVLKFKPVSPISQVEFQRISDLEKQLFNVLEFCDQHETKFAKIIRDIFLIEVLSVKNPVW